MTNKEMMIRDVLFSSHDTAMGKKTFIVATFAGDDAQSILEQVSAYEFNANSLSDVVVVRFEACDLPGRFQHMIDRVVDTVGKGLWW